MDHRELAACLDFLDWRQVDLQRQLRIAHGRDVTATTVWRYLQPPSKGGIRPPAGVAAFVILACQVTAAARATGRLDPLGEWSPPAVDTGWRDRPFCRGRLPYVTGAKKRPRRSKTNFHPETDPKRKDA